MRPWLRLVYRIVTYIPSNTYLVYGTGQALQAVHRLGAKERYVQWDGEYTSAYRLDPAGALILTRAELAPEQISLRTATEQFDIQLVNDQLENATTLGLVEQLKLEPIIQQEAVLGVYQRQGSAFAGFGSVRSLNVAMWFRFIHGLPR